LRDSDFDKEANDQDNDHELNEGETFLPTHCLVSLTTHR
jgi:hypothetical protein